MFEIKKGESIHLKQYIIIFPLNGIPKEYLWKYFN